PRRGEGIDLRQNAFDGILARTDGRGAACCGVGAGQGQLVVFAGYRARDDRLGRAVVVVDDVGDHHGDVVGAAAAQRQFDKAVGAVGDIGDLQGVEDGFVADRVGEAVRAQQVAITGAYFPHGQGGLDLMTGERPHAQRSLRVAVCLFPGDPPFVNQGLDERVVLGDLGQLAVAQQIAARIADVRQPKTVAREQDCGECSAHPLEVGFHLDLCGDGGVAGTYRPVELGQQVAAGFVVVEVGQCGNYQLGSDFSGGVPAHAVG